MANSLAGTPGCGWPAWSRLCLFFFQAEDGIRDLTVTGVQTCALQISSTASSVTGWVAGRQPSSSGHSPGPSWDRKSVVEGTRVDLGGRRSLKKKIEQIG